MPLRHQHKLFSKSLWLYITSCPFALNATGHNLHLWHAHQVIFSLIFFCGYLLITVTIQSLLTCPKLLFNIGECKCQQLHTVHKTIALAFQEWTLDQLETAVCERWMNERRMNTLWEHQELISETERETDTKTKRASKKRKKNILEISLNT